MKNKTIDVPLVRTVDLHNPFQECKSKEIGDNIEER